MKKTDVKSSIVSFKSGELANSDASLTNVRKGNQLERALTQVGTQTKLYYEREADRLPRIIATQTIPTKKGKIRQKGMQTEEPDE